MHKLQSTQMHQLFSTLMQMLSTQMHLQLLSYNLLKIQHQCTYNCGTHNKQKKTKTAAAKSSTKGPTNVTAGTAATNNPASSVNVALVTATTSNTSGKHVIVGDSSSFFVPRKSRTT